MAKFWENEARFLNSVKRVESSINLLFMYIKIKKLENFDLDPPPPPPPPPIALTNLQTDYLQNIDQVCNSWQTANWV